MRRHDHVQHKEESCWLLLSIGRFLEDVYMISDPFCAKQRPVALGSDCQSCGKMVCPDCSLFYTKRFCLACCRREASSFPLQLHKVTKRGSSFCSLQRSLQRQRGNLGFIINDINAHIICYEQAFA